MQSSNSSQNVTLPDIPELYNPGFLDILLPPSTHATPASDSATLVNEKTPKNAMMDALGKTVHRTRTQNLAPALDSTLSPTLDAFQFLSTARNLAQLDKYLDDSWAEDPALTLRIIWNIRSIHDGRANKEHFYQAFGWLYKHHPRTAIANLKLLVEPVCTIPNSEHKLTHGYWKDLLNILALAAVDELHGIKRPSKFLHIHDRHETETQSPGGGHPRGTRGRPHRGRGRGRGRPRGTIKPTQDTPSTEDPATRITASLAKDAERMQKAKEVRKTTNAQLFTNLTKKLSSDPKFQALYIAVARLFAGRLEQDLKIVDELAALDSTGTASPDERMALLRTLSLAGKWAPTPSGAHDRHTNISTAIVLLLRQAQIASFTSADLDPNTTIAAATLRAIYQRTVLTRLRSILTITEPLMASNRWTEIRYKHVPSACMKNNMETFYKHDPTGLQKYLTSVESGKQKISGATLFPHELIAAVASLSSSGGGGGGGDSDPDEVKKPDGELTLQEFRQDMKKMQLRIVEAQWKTLIAKLKESGSIENAIAICDVSGSMGSLFPSPWSRSDRVGGGKKFGASPVTAAVALSLVLAHLARPPFNSGFITFSSAPEFIRLDLEKPLRKTLDTMVTSAWEMNTDFKAVFLDLLLPLAVANKVPPEEMIKTLFVFSDMQFDNATGERGKLGGQWKTNHDVIAEAYKKAGYEMPRIVYWDLAHHRTVEVDGQREGVALMNGFSQGLLKVFMGETDEEEEKEAEKEEWEEVDEEGNVKAVKEEKKTEEFNPVSVMKKAVMKKSFDGLVVLD